MRAHDVRSPRFYLFGLITAAAVALLGGATLGHHAETRVQAAAPQQGGDPNAVINPAMFQGLRFRNVGPARGGRGRTGVEERGAVQAERQLAVALKRGEEVALHGICEGFDRDRRNDHLGAGHENRQVPAQQRC